MKYMMNTDRSQTALSAATIGITILVGVISAAIIFQLLSIKNTLHETEYSYFDAGLYESEKLKEAPTPKPDDFCLDVPVFTYHHIQPQDVAKEKGQELLNVDPVNFENHIKSLIHEGYRIISLEDLVDALEKKKELPTNTVVITLDDGYKDAYTYAFPIAKKYQIPLSVNIITNFIGNPEHVSRANMIEMQKSGFVTFQNHTWYHHSLGIQDGDIIDEQITVAEDTLMEVLGTSSKILVYPYGKYEVSQLDRVKNTGMRAAFSLDVGKTQCASNMYRLPRWKVGNAGPFVYEF